MPHLIARFGREGMAEVAIDEWMAASPIYTRRMQRLLGFEGDTVEVIFKGMQLDVGAPPEFMDFRYTVHDDLHGEFHLDHCGALMDVEPMGDDYVQAMCHNIEDPTFDATAAATNPRAQVRPIHRPPRRPTDRQPHCAWTVEIVPDAEPLPFPPQAEQLGHSHAAALPLAAWALRAGRSQAGVLRDEGGSWWLETPAGAARPLAGTLRIAFDFGAWMLLRFEPEGGRPRHWLAPSQADMPEAWPAFRRAVYSPRIAPAGLSAQAPADPPA